MNRAPRREALRALRQLNRWAAGAQRGPTGSEARRKTSRRRPSPRLVHCLRVSRSQALAFISEHAPAATAASRITGVPASFLLAQAALSSAWGLRMARGHNCFRLRGRGPAGFSIEPAGLVIGGRIVPARIEMRAYHTIGEGFVDYARSLGEAVWPDRVLGLIRAYALDRLDAAGRAPC